MSRPLRILLTLLAAAIGGWVGLMMVGGGAGGLAWIFVFGDDPWPAWAEPVLMTIAVLGGLLFAWRAGRSVWLALDKAASAGKTGP